MSLFRRSVLLDLLCSSWLLVFLAATTSAISALGGTAAGAESKCDGLSEVPIILGQYGDLHVLVTVRSRTLRFALDTGASVSVLDEASVSGLGLPIIEGARETLGVSGTAIPTGRTTLPDFILGDLNLGPLTIDVIDLEVLQGFYSEKGGNPPDGLLGMDVLRPIGAVLDLRSNRLLVNSTSAQPNVSILGVVLRVSAKHGASIDPVDSLDQVCGIPLPDAEVIFTDSSGTLHAVKTDLRGRFALEAMPLNLLQQAGLSISHEETAGISLREFGQILLASGHRRFVIRLPSDLESSKDQFSN